MKKIITGFITYDTNKWCPEDHGFRFHAVPMHNYGYVTVAPHAMEIDIPDDFDPRPEQIKLLEQEKRELQAKFAKDLMNIEHSISKLTCLTMDAS